MRDRDCMTKQEIENEERELLKIQEKLADKEYKRNYKQFEKEQSNPNDIADCILVTKQIITLEDTDEILAYNKETGLYEPAEQSIEKLIQNLCGETTSTHLVKEAIHSIRRQTRKPRSIVGAEINLIPLANGIYDFEKDKLITYGSEHVFLSKHPVVYNKTSEVVENPIDKFLTEVTAGQQDVLLLKEIIGYCFHRSTPFHIFVILEGKGANGKTVFLNLLREMIGKENVSNQSIQNLCENRFAVACLYGKNANIFGDLPAKAFQDVGTLKQVTGGDVIEAEQKFKNPFQFKNYAKIIASCNEVPETPDSSDGFFRRSVIVNFPRSFEGKENRNLLAELCTRDNLSDFFNTCIDAFRQALQDNTLARAETIAEKRERYINYSNSAAAFCQAVLDYVPESSLTIEAIFEAYKEFCEKKNISPKNEREFFKKLYKFFNHKVYKKRNQDAGIRWFNIHGVDWREEVEKRDISAE